jgi:hypothetical protein
MEMGRGLLRVVPNSEIVRHEREAAAAAAAASQAQDQVLSGLAGYVMPLWDQAKRAKNDIRPRLLASLRQRRGEYEPSKLAEIRSATGGSEIYMMLTGVKCRTAASWLRDALLGQGSNKPFTIAPSPNPEMPEEAENALMEAVGQEVGMMQAAGVQVPPDAVRERIDTARQALKAKLREQARLKAEDTERVLEDEMIEGGFHGALDEFIDDFVTYPAAILKGPVVHKAPRLTWTKQGTRWVPVVEMRLVKRWYRVDPFKFYPAPWSADVEDGYTFEHHRITADELFSLIGAPGYSEEAIRAAINDRAGLQHWLGMDFYNSADQINQPNQLTVTEGPLDALEFYGPVPGKHLMEWGVQDPEVTDPQASYNVNLWMIGRHIIKAAINPDPLGKKPYRKASYESIPGAFWGNGLPDILRDLQDVCNATARSLVNNMAIASGPQVWINVGRLPPGEKVTQLYPWKLHQFEEDPLGTTAPPMDFFQPTSNASELLNVFTFFSEKADEYSGLPRYMTGDTNIGGAGRTSSGLGMLMGNSNKLMKSVMGGVDRIIVDVVECTHHYLMQFEFDRFPELEGDIRIVARGAASVMQREQLALRRNEFLMATNNPTDMMLLGPQARSYVLHEQAKALELDTDRVVPQGMQAGQMPMMPMPGAAPGQAPQQGQGGPANGSQRPTGAMMDRPRTP